MFIYKKIFYITKIVHLIKETKSDIKVYPRPPQQLFYVQYFVPSSVFTIWLKPVHNTVYYFSFMINNLEKWKLLYTEGNVYKDFDTNWDEKATRDIKNHIPKVYGKKETFDTKFLWNIVTRRQGNDWCMSKR